MIQKWKVVMLIIGTKDLRYTTMRFGQLIMLPSDLPKSATKAL